MALLLTATNCHWVSKLCEVWIKGPEDIVTDKWEGKTVIDVAAANECKIGEWLLVQVWDES